jgi:SnoaL-like polyketide cyclase
MSSDSRELYRRYIEQLWTADDSELDALAAELVTGDFVIHQGRVDGADSTERRGPGALAQPIRESRPLFTDVATAVEVGPLVDGDRVAGRWVFRGTYAGGMPGATAPAGTKVAFGGMDIFRLESGRFAEYWVSSDGIDLMNQLNAGG